MTERLRVLRYLRQKIERELQARDVHGPAAARSGPEGDSARAAIRYAETMTTGALEQACDELGVTARADRADTARTG